jgi:alpha-beta hydrolase superfamily lysophospholipase
MRLVRNLLALGALALATACAPRTPAAAPAVALPQVITVPATASRQVDIRVFAPARPKGVLVFGHGASGAPERYGALFARLNAAGYAVLAPLHVDSLQHPDHARYNLQTAFPERIADVGAAILAAAQRFPGLPVAAAGHSYGALLAQMQGGALAQIPGARAPQVRAVVSFSSPGIIPGLVQPGSAFTTLTVPSLMVTGTADAVPGFVSNWEDHLASYRGAPAGKPYSLVLPSGDHYLIAGADPQHFDRAVSATILFLDAHLLGDAGARRRLDAPASGIQRR